jgi:hypothetical protein
MYGLRPAKPAGTKLAPPLTQLAEESTIRPGSIIYGNSGTLHVTALGSQTSPALTVTCNDRPMSEAHKTNHVSSKRLPRPSRDVPNQRNNRSAIVNNNQRLLEAQIDRWVNEGGALSPKRYSHQGRGFNG